MKNVRDETLVSNLKKKRERGWDEGGLIVHSFHLLSLYNRIRQMVFG